MYHGPLPKIKEEMISMETIQIRPGSGRVATFARNIRTAFTAAKAGHTVAPVRQIPVVSFEFWSWTPEVCLDFTRPTRAAVREIFRTFDRGLLFLHSGDLFVGVDAKVQFFRFLTNCSSCVVVLR